MIRRTRELDQLNKRVIKIEYEIIQGERGNVEEEIGKEAQVDRNMVKRRRRGDPRRRRAHRVAVHRRVLAR